MEPRLRRTRALNYFRKRLKSRQCRDFRFAGMRRLEPSRLATYTLLVLYQLCWWGKTYAILF